MARRTPLTRCAPIATSRFIFGVLGPHTKSARSADLKSCKVIWPTQLRYSHEQIRTDSSRANASVHRASMAFFRGAACADFRLRRPSGHEINMYSPEEFARYQNANLTASDWTGIVAWTRWLYMISFLGSLLYLGALQARKRLERDFRSALESSPRSTWRTESCAERSRIPRPTIATG